MRACTTCGGETETLAMPRTNITIHHCRRCAEQSHNEAIEADEQRAADDLIRRAGATPRMRAWSLDTYATDATTDKLADLARAWLAAYAARDEQRGVHNLYFYGGAGTGKTGLAWSIVRELLRAEFRRARDYRDEHLSDRLVTRVPAMILDTRAYLDEQRKRIGRGEDADRFPQRVPVLVLDDVGSERDTAWAVEQLGLIVSYRYDHELPLIVTSNYSPIQLAERLSASGSADGERLLSRICDAAMIVHFDHHDRRTHAA